MIFLWGTNEKCQLPVGNELTYCEPKHLNFYINCENIRRIICGSTWTFILDDQYQCHVCGNNKDGQLGLTDVKVLKQVIPLDLGFIKVESVAAGWDFTILLTTDKKVYCSGNNELGQLGLNKTKVKKLNEFTELDVCAMSQIAAGNAHVVSVSVDGRVWTWGYNSRLQLGYGPATTTPQLPTALDIDLGGGKVKYVAAGEAHTLLAIDDSRLFAWGSNRFGECGNPKSDEVWIKRSVLPREMDIGTVEEIVQLESGWSHGLILDHQGHCFSWGYNLYGQLGRGSGRQDASVEAVEMPEEATIVQDVSCGSQHCLARDSRGQLWAWGFNLEGSLGLGDYDCRQRPTKHELLPPLRVISQGAAVCFVVPVTDTL